ncbi:MAG: TonB-dependent receptor plug domain-containing protein [Acidobacteria bacterium]|nr:TonB-dependent receptor plug domain-containing protein [Acidobacteriota bacterium]
MQRTLWHVLRASLLLALSCVAAQAVLAQQGSVTGAVNDTAGAAVITATVELINLAASNVRTARPDANGKYSFSDVAAGQYRLVVKAPGYNDLGKTIKVENAPVTENFELTPGNIKEVMNVTASRGLSADQDTPLNVSTETAQTIEEKLPVSPGEILKDVPSLFVFNSNSPLSSPNLRGLQASRVLLVVDGERVNNSRTEIQTFGASLGSYIDTFNIENVEVVAGAGSSLYGTDSLTGTVNFTTKEPARPDKGWLLGGKFQGLYSTNETGRKGNVTVNLSNPKFAINWSGTLYRFDNYHFGDPGNGSDIGLAAIKKQQDELKYLSNSNTSRQDFEISDSFVKNFGLGVPQNSTRTTVQNSLSHGANGFWNMWLHPADKHSIRLKAQNNRLGYYGFPVQAPAYWHDLQWTSFEKNDKYGARYNGVEFGGALKRLAGGYYYQKLVRPIDNITLVTPAVRPPCIRGLFESAANCTAANQAIFQTVTRPSALTFNKQVVVTNGADVQATFQLIPKNNLIAGYQFWRDKSGDELNSSVYNTTPGTPGRTVPVFSPFAGYTLNTAIPVIAGKGTADSYNQESALFFADEQDITRWLKVSLSYRFSHFTSKVFQAPGFPLAGGARRH